MARLESCGGEAVAPLSVTNDADGDRGSGLLRADQHPLHGAFLRRRNLPGERILSLGLCGKELCDGNNNNNNCEDEFFHLQIRVCDLG